MKPIIVCFLILILVGPAAGEDYQPLETGNFWSYVAEGGAEEMRVVAEPVPIFNGIRIRSNTQSAPVTKD